LRNLPAPAADHTPFELALDGQAGFDLNIPEAFTDIPDSFTEALPNNAAPLRGPEDPGSSSSQVSMADLHSTFPSPSSLTTS
jgi:hypothetical protein